MIKSERERNSKSNLIEKLKESLDPKSETSKCLRSDELEDVIYYLENGFNINNINNLNESIKKLKEQDKIETSLISDEYHTFDELYFHRMILFSVICKMFKKEAWRSKKHYDNTMFDDYFIVGVNTPNGQYSYHYHKNFWNYFDEIKELEKDPEWDGHTPDNIERLLSLLSDKDVKMENINTNLSEGKYLLAALSIMTTSDFTIQGKIINGSSKTPDDVLKYLQSIVKDMGI
jgi:hypothetical protein